MDNLPDDGPCEVTITAPDREWLQQLAQKLVEERLVAAAHLDTMFSTYRWMEEVQEAHEARVLLHTRLRAVAHINERLNKQHPYEVTCLVARLLAFGNDRCMRWIDEQVIS